MATACVFGRGFGLYGHAAALGELGYRVYLPEDYQLTVDTRPDLEAVKSAFSYFSSLEEIIGELDLITLARRPQDNLDLADSLIRRGFKGRLVVEKPLGTDPDSGSSFLDFLQNWKINVTVPYILAYCDMYPDLIRCRSEGGQLEIEWSLYQVNRSTGWKNTRSEGGGALGYFGAHFLALFAELEERPQVFERFMDGWTIRGERLTTKFYFSENSRFKVRCNDTTICNLPSPFGQVPGPGAIDTRIPMLRRFYTSLKKKQYALQDIFFHRTVNDYWRQALESALPM